MNLRVNFQWSGAANAAASEFLFGSSGEQSRPANVFADVLWRARGGEVGA